MPGPGFLIMVWPVRRRVKWVTVFSLGYAEVLHWTNHFALKTLSLCSLFERARRLSLVRQSGEESKGRKNASDKCNVDMVDGVNALYLDAESLFFFVLNPKWTSKALDSTWRFLLSDDSLTLTVCMVSPWLLAGFRWGGDRFIQRKRQEKCVSCLGKIGFVELFAGKSRHPHEHKAKRFSSFIFILYLVTENWIDWILAVCGQKFDSKK